MSAKKGMPKSRAKTAYGLLGEIARLALAEPKRIRMAWWLTDPGAMPEDKRPACGTVGCIGGWVLTLKGTRAQQRDALRGAVTDAGDNAAAILGLKESQAHALFDPFVRGRAGTVTQARAVAARIRRFQKQYAAQLKAKAV